MTSLRLPSPIERRSLSGHGCFCSNRACFCQLFSFCFGSAQEGTDNHAARLLLERLHATEHRLTECLTDLDMFGLLKSADYKFDLHKYWQLLEKQGTL